MLLFGLEFDAAGTNKNSMSYMQNNIFPSQRLGMDMRHGRY